jgi:hypothetical protein
VGVLRIAYKLGLISIICLVLFFSYLYYDTSAFFTPTTTQPIQVYYSISQGILVHDNQGNVIGSHQNYGTIASISFSITQAFNNSTSDFQILYTNFTQRVDFWSQTGNGNEEEWNQTQVAEYTTTHIPDFIIKSPFVNNSSVPVWSQVWHSQPTWSVETNSLFHETSYGVWETEYFFDAGFSGLTAYNDTYIEADVQQMVFQVTIPNSYHIEDAGLYKLQQQGDAIVLSQTLNSGDTFHLVVEDKSTNNVKAVVSFFNPLILGALLGVVATQIYEGRKSKRRGKK